MPRQLPWKVNTTTTKPKSTTATPRAASSTSTSRLTPHSRTATPGSTGTGTSKPRRSLTLDVNCTSPPSPLQTAPTRILTPLARTPSPSPPPSPLPEAEMHTPHDDRFRMVEDEFLATAQQFTRHLHQAEYQRLKVAAAARAEGDAEAIRRGEVREERVIVRPVVGAPAGGRVEGRRREREGGGLRGLLSSPPRREMPLLVLGRGRGGSPSRGEGRRVVKEEGGGSRVVKDEEGRGGDDVGRRRTGMEEGRKRRSEVLKRREPERGRVPRSTSPLPWVPPDDDEDDDDDFISRMRAEREEKRRKRESGVKRAGSPTISLDDIPFI